jgi:dual specificity MAP kinase phosphatase
VIGSITILQTSNLTLILAYLMWKNKTKFEPTFELLRSKRWQIDPNPGFVRQLREYESELGL